ncbi:MAG: DNA (cytosine-5-)-methyltransferase [Janthinobacterium lividum]
MSSSSESTGLLEGVLGPAAANHIARSVGCDVQRRIDALGIGQKMQDLPEELWHKSFRFYVKEDPTRRGGPNLRLIRLDPNKPSLTVTAYIFNKFVHPFEDRFVTVREAARLQGFPDDLRFEGTLTSTQLQVGNAVPVPLARAVFQAILCHAQARGFPDRPLKAASLFSGAGGMDIGAEQALLGAMRVETKMASEYWVDACRTLSGHYRGRASVIPTDLSEVKDPQKHWHLLSGETQGPDIVFGGPPCQAFSQAGKQKGLNDERSGMVYHFLRFVEHLEPEFFVMENVPNLKGTGGGQLYQHILEQMQGLGYEVTVCSLLAADFGAPQRRRRLFFIGSRMGRIEPPQPTHSSEFRLFHTESYLTVGEAFAGLPPAMFSVARNKTT